MPKHIQRKLFPHPDLAAEQAAEFNHPRWQIPGIEITAAVVERDDGCWLYVIQEGETVSGDEPLLPDYEKVNESAA